MNTEKKVADIDKIIAKVEFILEDRRSTIEQIQSKVAQTEEEKIWIGQELQLRKIIQSMVRLFKQRVQDSLGIVRPTPEAFDLEEAVLGALILEEDALRGVYKFLRTEHFHDEQHRVIYEAVLRLVAERKPVDMRTVIMKLVAMGKIGTSGGPLKIAEMTSKVSSAANIEYHARIIMEMAIKRELLYLGHDVMQQAYDPTCDVFVMLDEVQKRFNGIKEAINLNQIPDGKKEYEGGTEAS